MTPWSQLAPKVHLRRKVKYWKCHFLSALHFPEIQGSRSETFRLHRFSFTSDSLSPNSLPGVAVLTSMYTKGFHGLQVTSCRLQARGGRLQFFICICCLGVARWNYFSNMWDRQISMRLTRGATCVVGGRDGMDETHQVNIHFNWDNLSFFLLPSSFFLLPSSFLLLTSYFLLLTYYFIIRT